jgi:hypothetical protein
VQTILSAAPRRKQTRLIAVMLNGTFTTHNLNGCYELSIKRQVEVRPARLRPSATGMRPLSLHGHFHGVAQHCRSHLAAFRDLQHDQKQLFSE